MKTQSVYPIQPGWSGYRIVKQAIESRTPIRATYGTRSRILCPHAVGWKDGKLHVLCFQSGGASTSGLSTDPNDNWRCLNLAKMSQIQLAGDESWRTAHSHRRPSTCIDEILDQIPAT